MKFAVAFALAALGATSVAAYADQANRVFIRHHGAMLDIDANHDGWVTRAEAAAAADRMFDELDTNHDGRLTETDRRAMHADFDMRIPGPEGVLEDVPEGDQAPDDRNCTRTAEGDRVTIICNSDSDGQGAQRVERRVIVRHGEHGAEHAEAERHVEREVTIITRDDDDDDTAAPEAPPAPPAAPEAPRAPMAAHPPFALHAPHAPDAPHAPHAPMFMMLLASSDEMDTNHDGAISREEFRAQQLRFFAASDANGDGRIRFEPPEPSLPSLPPLPPPASQAPLAPAAPTPPPAPR